MEKPEHVSNGDLLVCDGAWYRVKFLHTEYVKAHPLNGEGSGKKGFGESISLFNVGDFISYTKRKNTATWEATPFKLKEHNAKKVQKAEIAPTPAKRGRPNKAEKAAKAEKAPTLENEIDFLSNQIRSISAKHGKSELEIFAYLAANLRGK